jgi:hypothetical protein
MKQIGLLMVFFICGCASLTNSDTRTPKTNVEQRGVSEREKMLLRFILQEEFACDPRSKLSHTSSLDAILTQHIKSTNALLRHQAILSLGTTGWGSQLDAEKAQQVLREVLKAETGTCNWIKLDAARVLAWFGDDAGKSILADALYGRDGFKTSSGIEYRKAVIPLLLIDYDFPEGLPRGNMVWGGLKEYLNDEAKKRKPNKPIAGDAK